MSGDCGNREERLVSLLYEDGDPAELAEIRAHLSTCVACREEFQKLTSTRELLAAWPDVVNAPRMIYLKEPAPAGGLPRRGAGRRSWDRFGAFLPSLAAAAMVVLVLGLSAPFLRFQIGPDGRLGVGFGGSSEAAAGRSALVTRGDLDQGLAQTAQYLETLMQTGRDQDRQTLLSVVDQALGEQNASVQKQVTTAISSAFDEIDRRRRADLGVMLSSMSDLQVMTRDELQRMNAVLASLTPAPSEDKER